MRLTRIQSKFLNSILQQQDTQASLSRKLLIRSRRWLLLGALCAGGAFCVWQLQLYSLSNIYIGFWTGGVLADLGWMLTSHRLWPIIKEIIDWNKVNQLVEDHEKSV